MKESRDNGVCDACKLWKRREFQCYIDRKGVKGQANDMLVEADETLCDARHGC